jgi:hypothetical protein
MNSTHGFWRKCRFAFRCARFTVWAGVLLLLAAIAWVNVVGLPPFLKTRLVTAMRERGVQLEFSRMRLRFIHGLVCDNVRVGGVQSAGAPVFSAREVQVRIDYPALFHGRVEVDGLVLHYGKFVVPVDPGNALSVTNIEGALSILPEDTWSLDYLRADFDGTTISLGGEIVHAPEFRNWKMFTARAPSEQGGLQSILRQFSETLKRVHLAGNPQINARLTGDARDVHSLKLAVTARAPAVRTPGFAVSNLEFAARVTAPTNAPLFLDPAWGFWTNLQPFRVDWLARSADVEWDKLEASALDSRGNWMAPELSLNQLAVRFGDGTLQAAAKLEIGSRDVDFEVHSAVDPHVLETKLPEQARGWLARLDFPQPPRLNVAGSLVVPPWTNGPDKGRSQSVTGLRLRGDAALTNAQWAGATVLESGFTHFTFADRLLTVPDLELAQGRTSLGVTCELNDSNHLFRCTIGGDFDPANVRPFLENSNEAHAFDLLTFKQPVSLVLDVTGNAHKFSTFSATGRVVVAGVAVRGQTVDRVVSSLSYANRRLELFQPQLSRADGAQHFTAEKVAWDLSERTLYLHHGVGNVEPMVVARAIGPKTAEGMAPYQFTAIPEGTVDGAVPFRINPDGNWEPSDADLWFAVVGTAPFRWRRFETPAISGNIHWLGRYLILTNVVGECYGGPARGWGVFDLDTVGEGTDFSFFMQGTNVDFNAMGCALWSPTNRLRGALSGNVTVTRANSDDWRTWDGYGQMQLRNGLLWDAPIFGLVSSVINTLVPGLDLGNIRGTDAIGRFTMTNGVIYTDSFQIRSLTMRLDYVGTVNLDKDVEARVRAQLLRNTPVVGSLFSMILSPVSKILECQITGTLDQPKIVPIYIPFTQMLKAPLYPFRALGKMFTPAQTNSPPE